MPTYNEAFYLQQREGSKKSASVILPIVFDIFKPKAVVDIGCGVGTWLSIAGKLGATKLVGLEGNWVKDVKKEPGNIQVNLCDLEREIAAPAQKFDLALCLEVAEHLSERRSESLVGDLCTLSDVVLFGAAIPGQGGTMHINEQWQSYWATKFRRRGYLPYDVVRPQIWNNADVELWYRQNMLVYAKSSVEGYAQAQMIDVIHPGVYEWKNPPRSAI